MISRKLKSNLKTIFLPLVLIIIYTALININIPELGDIIFTQTFILQKSNFICNSLNLNNNELLLLSQHFQNSNSSSPFAITAEKQKTLVDRIDRMQDENRQLLSRLTDLENVFKSSTYSIGRNVNIRYQKDFYYNSDNKEDYYLKRRKSLFSISSSSINCSSVFSVAHFSNDRIDTDITDYETYDLYGKTNEKSESENKEYWMNRIVKMLEEEDPQKSYNLEHVTAGGNGKIYKAERINSINSNNINNNNKIYAIKAISLSTTKLLNLTYAEIIGGSLWDIRNRKPNKRFNEMEITFVMREVLKGLEYIHDLGIIHRDVKAQNILIDNDGKVKIADFGSVSLCSKASLKLGTLYWMAPEVLRDNQVYDCKADIWSLGITAIELFDGRPPCVSEDFDSFLRNCLTMKPQERPNANELLSHEFLDHYNEIRSWNDLK
ncbi:10286_t:CDS:2 [Diversispora eburnea]|uniref:10286_t:CDS:1 n=1 Tax=Diversispora eburnea TaxID=1213867 RepID=A0A9N9F847_9GLOM|nr:10286_t:CDS:2 [Diversispora eburnea]